MNIEIRDQPPPDSEPPIKLWLSYNPDGQGVMLFGEKDSEIIQLLIRFSSDIQEAAIYVEEFKKLGFKVPKLEDR